MERKKEGPLGFIFAIRPIEDNEGNVIDWHAQFENLGVQEEIVLTMVRHWLRAAEDKYFNERFNNNV